MQCYYSILEISKNSKPEEIKNAHRKLMKKYHPDKIEKNISENEKIKFNNKCIEINRAYEILFDKEKRKIYDTKGFLGIIEYEKNKDLEDIIKEAKERNEERKRDRILRKSEKEKKLKEEQEIIKKQEEERLRRKKIEIEEREKIIAEKRQKEIELENKIKEDIKQINNLRTINKIKNKTDFLKKKTFEFITPIKKIVLEIDFINILNVEEYIHNHIILKFTDLIVNNNEIFIKELYFKLKKIKDYFDYEFNEPFTKKNIRGKLLLKQFINICNEYYLDSYVFEQYEIFLKKNNIYDNNNFEFLEKICSVFIGLIENIIPDIYFI
jgi:curved DNA-binding protein CbpA